VRSWSLNALAAVTGHRLRHGGAASMAAATAGACSAKIASSCSARGLSRAMRTLKTF
jgi:hypothetical protein